MKYPVTPDGRYFLFKDRLWRCSNPPLEETVRQKLVNDLMKPRFAIKHARSKTEVNASRANVQIAKVGLGERGPV